jgi:hypothetical protein
LKNRFYKIVRQPVGKLRQDLANGTRLLVFYLEPFSEELRACWPLNDVPDLSDVAGKVIGACAKRLRPVMIHDVKVDPLTGGSGEARFGSALVVPLLDESNNMVGILYADHPEVGAFTKQHRMVMERLARSLTPKLPIWSPNPVKEMAEQEKLPAFDYRWAAAAGSLVLFFWSFGPFLWARKPPSRRPLTSTQAVRDERPPATRTMASFIKLLQLRQFEQAYQMMHPELQALTSEADFVQQASQWFADEGNVWGFNRREMRLDKESESQASFRLEPTQELGEEASWRWAVSLYQPEAQGEETPQAEWRVNRLRGGPFRSPSDSER